MINSFFNQSESKLVYTRIHDYNLQIYKMWKFVISTLCCKCNRMDSQIAIWHHQILLPENVAHWSLLTCGSYPALSYVSDTILRSFNGSRLLKILNYTVFPDWLTVDAWMHIRRAEFFSEATQSIVVWMLW